jgi:predicted Zn-dependent protease
MFTKRTSFAILMVALSAASTFAAELRGGPGEASARPILGSQFVPIVEQATPEDRRLPRLSSGWTETYPETGITFLEYVTNSPRRPKRAQRTIFLVPLGDFRDTRSLERIRGFVNAYFSLPVRIAKPREIPARSYSRSKRRYNADEILLDMQLDLADPVFVATGITSADLYSGRLDSVYGLSYSDLRTSIVSTRHLWRDENDSNSPEERLRLAKLIVHEICHNLGFPHCAAHACRMNGTSGFRDLERAPTHLCGPCQKKLQWNIGFDPLARYRAIKRALRHMGCRHDTHVYSRRIHRLEAERDGYTPALTLARAEIDD